MTSVQFDVHAAVTRTQARAGRLRTPHGELQTPALCPAAPQATVKSLDSDELEAAGIGILLVDTYHLGLRPGSETVVGLGGLHTFMSWRRPLISDGGPWTVVTRTPFDVDRLDTRRRGRGQQGRLVRMDDDAVTFTSHIDGSTHRLTPELSIGLQEALGADVIQAFDSPPAALREEAALQAVQRSALWARQSLDARTRQDQGLFGVVQAGPFRSLCERSASEMGALPFDGYVIQKVSGQAPADALAWSLPFLPPERPRLVHANGDPSAIFDAVEAGIDLIVSGAPIAHARRGRLYTVSGPIDITGEPFREDFTPVDDTCDCVCCLQFSRSYLHHLFDARELLAYRLATLHNLSFTSNLMHRTREAVMDDTVHNVRQSFFSNWPADAQVEEPD